MNETLKAKLEQSNEIYVNQPVKHGKWRKKFLSDIICCSECKATWSSSFKDMLNGFNYCPNCGARMDFKDGDTE